MESKQELIEYHIFTHNDDHWTRDIEEALKVAMKMFEDTESVRIYKEYYLNGRFQKEKCLFTLGIFPL